MKKETYLDLASAAAFLWIIVRGIPVAYAQYANPGLPKADLTVFDVVVILAFVSWVTLAAIIRICTGILKIQNIRKKED